MCAYGVVTFREAYNFVHVLYVEKRDSWRKVAYLYEAVVIEGYTGS